MGTSKIRVSDLYDDVCYRSHEGSEENGLEPPPSVLDSRAIARSSKLLSNVPHGESEMCLAAAMPYRGRTVKILSQQDMLIVAPGNLDFDFKP
jgi:hypothetical protein